MPKPPPPTPPSPPPTLCVTPHRPHRPHRPQPPHSHRPERFAYTAPVTPLILTPSLNVCPNPLRPHCLNACFAHPLYAVTTLPPPTAHRLHSSVFIMKCLEASNACPNPLPHRPHRPHRPQRFVCAQTPSALTAFTLHRPHRPQRFTPLPPLLTAFCPWFGLCKSLSLYEVSRGFQCVPKPLRPHRPHRPHRPQRFVCAQTSPLSPPSPPSALCPPHCPHCSPPSALGSGCVSLCEIFGGFQCVPKPPPPTPPSPPSPLTPPPQLCVPKPLPPSPPPPSSAVCPPHCPHCSPPSAFGSGYISLYEVFRGFQCVPRPPPPPPPSPPPALCVCPNPLRPHRLHRPHRSHRPQRFVHPTAPIAHRLLPLVRVI